MIYYRLWQQPNFREINKFYKKNGHKGKANGNDRVFYAYTLNEDEKQIIAAVRLCPVTDDLHTSESIRTEEFWLRSMWVKKELRQQGIGQALLTSMQDFLQRHACFCFPYDHLQYFYQQAGFNLMEMDEVPAPLADKYLGYKNAGEKIILMGRIPTL